jgi:putative endonuclease
MDLKKKKELGDLGEEVAEEYLKKKGYTILQKKFSPGPGEIDIIAANEDWNIFVEVKTRTSIAFGTPEESIDFNKIDRIRKAAIAFLKDNKPDGKKSIRFDILSIIISKDKLEKLLNRDTDSRKLAAQYKIFSRIEHITDAF